MARQITPAIDRLMAKVHKTSTCWLWTGAVVGRKGYGVMYPGSDHSSRLVHRISYEIHVGPIPEGLDIGHLCRNTACVRPSHLEPVERPENSRRVGMRRTRCGRGLHDKTPANTIKLKSGEWRCYPCAKEWRSRHKAQGALAA